MAVLSFGRVAVGWGEAVSCGQCAPASLSGTAAAGYRPAEEIIAELIAARSVDLSAGVLFTGLEPLAHPALPRIISAATDAGVERIGISTSAALFIAGGNATGAIGAGVRVIEIPLLGPDAATHDAYAGQKGAFEASRAGVGRFRDAAEETEVRVAVRGRVDVCAHTTPILPQVIVTFASWGAASVELRVRGSLPRSAIEQVHAACETGMVNGVWVAVAALDTEFLGKGALHGTDVMSFTEVVR
ncbi:MAG: hypothetical protein KGZ40_07580 [Clostridiales bacterium]|nr:hypothetical protein [Clostridiales bacterium]